MRMSKRARTIVLCAALGVVVAAAGVLVLGGNLERSARKSHAQWTTKFATVYGQLHNEDGRAVRMNGNVLLCGKACFSAQSTLLRGEFAFTRVPPGQYRLYAVHNGCKSDEWAVVAEAGIFNALDTPLSVNHC